MTLHATGTTSTLQFGTNLHDTTCDRSEERASPISVGPRPAQDFLPACTAAATLSLGIHLKQGAILQSKPAKTGMVLTCECFATTSRGQSIFLSGSMQVPVSRTGSVCLFTWLYSPLMHLALDPSPPNPLSFLTHAPQPLRLRPPRAYPTPAPQLLSLVATVATDPSQSVRPLFLVLWDLGVRA